MQISDELKQFLKENREELSKSNPNFEKLYKELEKVQNLRSTSEFTELLYAAGVDPLTNLDYIPTRFLFDSKISNFNIPGHIKSIGNFAFYNCTELKSITIPSSVESIGHSAFYWCSSLTSISMVGAKSLKRIGTYAFGYCTGLTSIDMTGAKNLLNIGGYAFGNCISLTSVDMAGATSLTSIGDYAFARCSKLTSITIPSGIISIGFCAFDDCNRLTDIYYSSTKEDRDQISIYKYNTNLIKATWHYNS